MTGMPQPASPLSVGSLAQLTLSLIAIVALILVISWALKRLKLAGPRGSGEIAVLDQLSVGPRERIVLVRVGESQVLVGIGAQGWCRSRRWRPPSCSKDRRPRRRSPSVFGIS